VFVDKVEIDPAKKACGSHVRVYTTLRVAEKGILNHKAMHNQHLVNGLWIRNVP